MFAIQLRLEHGLEYSKLFSDGGKDDARDEALACSVRRWLALEIQHSLCCCWDADVGWGNLEMFVREMARSARASTV